jgi:cation:H+ antiporter
MFILGFTAIITPVTFNGKMLTRELPFNMFASILLILLSGSMLVGGAPGEYLTRLDGAIMLFFCVLFIIYTFGIKNDAEDEPAPRVITVKRAILFIVLGLLCLIFGGKLFVNGAAEIARALGLSDALIGITIVSVGSSLPELAVSVNAARKGNVGIALGNVLGSNILNIFFILGTAATITPISLSGFSFVDYYVLLGSSVLIYLVARFGGKAVINRFEGALLVVGYVAYTTYLVMNA